MAVVTIDELIAHLQLSFPGYWEWLQQRPGTHAFERVNTILRDIRSNTDWTLARMQRQVVAQISQLTSFETFSAAPTDEPPADEIPPEDEDLPPLPDELPPWQTATPAYDSTRDVRAALQQFLIDNELPLSLMGFIQQSLALDKPMSQIIAELRQTPEYKQAYPENDLRSANGLPWMSETEIRAYRDEAKRITREYMGVDASNAEISQIIGRGTSLRSWEHRLQVNDAVERWGGAVQQVFEGYIGAPLSSERLHMFFDPDYDTSQIDDMYEMAVRQGQPTLLGFAIRPEEEARLLQSMGISVDQVFKNYQTIRGEMPRFERLAAIGNYLDQQGQDFFGDVSMSGSLLFRAVQLGDPEALKELQRRSSEEAVRWQATGGPARTSGGVVSGLSPR